MHDEKVRRLGARMLTKATGRTADDVGAALNAIQQLTPLPDSYRELLMRFRGPIVFDNGARFTSDEPSPLNDKNGFQSLELLYGVGGGQYSVEQKIRQYEGELPAGFIPVGEAPSGNLLCVDESGTGITKVCGAQEAGELLLHWSSSSTDLSLTKTTLPTRAESSSRSPS